MDKKLMPANTHPESKPALLPCRKCGSEDVDWWDGSGSQAELTCNECSQGEHVQVTDLFEHPWPKWDANYKYDAATIAVVHKHLAEEWNTRAPAVRGERSPDAQAGIDGLQGLAGDGWKGAEAVLAYIRSLESENKTLETCHSHLKRTYDNVFADFLKLEASAQGWRAVDDKAKEGEVVWISNGFFMRLAFWSDGPQYEHQGSIGGGWRDFGASEHGGLTDLKWLPTHWQPLPAQPNKKDGE